MVKAYRPPPFHTLERHRLGSSWPPTPWLTKFANSRKRAQPHHRLVSCLETLMELLRSKSSQVRNPVISATAVERCSRQGQKLTWNSRKQDPPNPQIEWYGSPWITWLRPKNCVYIAHRCIYASAWSLTDGVIGINRPCTWDTRGPLHVD